MEKEEDHAEYDYLPFTPHWRRLITKAPLPRCLCAHSTAPLSQVDMKSTWTGLHFQVIVNKLWFKDTLHRSILRPRVHTALSKQSTVVVEGEPNRDFPPNIANLLTSRKHDVTSNHDFPPSGVHCVSVDDNGAIEGGLDPRRGDRAQGF